jgi:sRNA-binding protein
MTDVDIRYILPPTEYKEIYAELRKLFPKLFCKKKIFLMKKGIFQDIIKRNNLSFSNEKLRKFFKIYTDKKAYQNLHLKIGEKRYNLNGEVEGQVNKEEVIALRHQRKEMQDAKLRRKMQQDEDFEYCYDNVTNIRKSFSKVKNNQAKKTFATKLGVKK